MSEISPGQKCPAPGCGRPIPQRAKGRAGHPRKWCSSNCRTKEASRRLRERRGKAQGAEAPLKELDLAEVRALKKEIAGLKKTVEKQATHKSLLRIAVQEALTDLPRIEIPRRPKRDRPGRSKAREEIAILHVSDTQIGKVTASYNSEVAEQRLMVLTEKVLEVINIRRSFAKIDEVRVYFGGDLIEGEQIFPGQAHEIDQSVFDQAVRTAPRIFARVLLRLLEEVDRVHCPCVPGNHGRNGRRGGDQNPRTNWDNVTCAVLETMLLGYEGNRRSELAGRLTFEHAKDFYVVDRVWKWGNLIVHGDQITGGFAGFPWYGTAKKAWGWIDSIPEHWETLWFGHFHTAASATLNHRMFMANGTTESGNVYAQAQLAATGYPCQRLAFFNEKHGLISDNLIYLSDERKPASERHH